MQVLNFDTPFEVKLFYSVLLVLLVSEQDLMLCSVGLRATSENK